MRIDRATPEDLDEVCGLRLAFLAEVRRLGPDPLPDDLVAGTAAFVARHHGDGSLHSWLARDGATTPGLVSLLVTPAPPLPDDDRTCDGLVLNMYVVPGARNRGVARALLAACTAGARDVGVRRLGLYATDDGRPLYVAAGFGTSDDWMEQRLD